MRKPLCVFHVADLDGHCSGEIVRRALGDVDLIAANYTDDIPSVDVLSDRDVIVVDFHYKPWERMVELDQLVSGKLIWIDHHEDAVAEHDSHAATTGRAFFGKRCSEEHGPAACELAWKHFARLGKLKPTLPRAVHLLGRYDAWEHDAVPNIVNFQYGMQARITDPRDTASRGLWGQLLQPARDRDADMLIERIISEGCAVRDYITKQNALHAEQQAFTMSWQGYTCLFANRIFAGQEYFQSIWNPRKHDIMVLFGWTGKSWKVSLRTTKDIDVSKIAREYDGGGHPKAAAFYAAKLPFRITRGEPVRG